MRAQLELRGPSFLDDAELLALVLGRSRATADAVMRRAGSLHHLARAQGPELEALCRLPPSLAERLRAALELGRRAVDAPLCRGDPIVEPGDVVARLRGRLAPLEHEELHVLGLDSHSRLVTHFVAAVGNANAVRISPREVFRPLVRAGACAAIVVHNHPSGSSEPSDEDAALTGKLGDCGGSLGIPVLDHVVIARDGYYSFSTAGRMRPTKSTTGGGRMKFGP